MAAVLEPVRRALRALVVPESSVIAIAELSQRTKFALFLVAIAAFWAIGIFVVDNTSAIPWRLFGLFVPILAALLWGGLIALGIYLISLPATYLLISLRGFEFVGGVAGPMYAIATLTVVGLLHRYIMQIHAARARIRTLEGILPICASCKQIRDESGRWNQLEAYLSRRITAQFSHGICPDCLRTAFADLT